MFNYCQINESHVGGSVGARCVSCDHLSLITVGLPAGSCTHTSHICLTENGELKMCQDQRRIQGKCIWQPSACYCKCEPWFNLIRLVKRPHKRPEHLFPAAFCLRIYNLHKVKCARSPLSPLTESELVPAAASVECVLLQSVLM